MPFKKFFKKFKLPYYKKSGSVKNKPLFITDRKRSVVRQQIRLVADNNAVELVFKRRLYPPKRRDYHSLMNRPTPIRRMFCTSNWKYLNDNRQVFGYKKARRLRSDSWYRQRNLMLVFDLVLQKYRMISLDDYRIMNTFPLETKVDQLQFIDRYKEMGKRKNLKQLTKLFNK